MSRSEHEEIAEPFGGADAGFAHLFANPDVSGPAPLTISVSSRTFMRAFGISLSRESLSDEEYVNRVRKGLRVVRWSRWLFGLFIAVIAFSVWAVIGLPDFFASLGGKEGPDRQLLYRVIGLALMSGACLGFWIGHLGEVVANAFFGFRRDRLLIECWDALHQDTAREKKS